MGIAKSSYLNKSVCEECLAPCRENVMQTLFSFFGKQAKTYGKRDLFCKNQVLRCMTCLAWWMTEGLQHVEKEQVGGAPPQHSLGEHFWGFLWSRLEEGISLATLGTEMPVAVLALPTFHVEVGSWLTLLLKAPLSSPPQALLVHYTWVLLNKAVWQAILGIESQVWRSRRAFKVVNCVKHDSSVLTKGSAEPRLSK